MLLQALLSGECVGAVLGRSDWDLYRYAVCGNRAPLLAPRLASTPAHASPTFSSSSTSSPSPSPSPSSHLLATVTATATTTIDSQSSVANPGCSIFLEGGPLAAISGAWPYPIDYATSCTSVVESVISAILTGMRQVPHT